MSLPASEDGGLILISTIIVACFFIGLPLVLVPVAITNKPFDEYRG